MNNDDYRMWTEQLAPDKETAQQWILALYEAGYALTGKGALDKAGDLMLGYWTRNGAVKWAYFDEARKHYGWFADPVAAHAAAMLTGVPGPRSRKRKDPGAFDDLFVAPGTAQRALQQGIGTPMGDPLQRLKDAVRRNGLL